MMQLVLTLLLLATLPQAQSKPEQAIIGRVLFDDGQPAAYASIEAYAVGTRGGSLSAVCDEAGNFTLSALAPGSYKLAANAPGYVLDSRSSGDNVYRAGDRVTLQLVRGGVITGRVTDAAGEPMVAVGVNLYRVRDEDGNRAVRGSTQHVDALTDDRGIYRAFGLEPGAYVVGVEVSDGGHPSGRDVPTWYPATTRDAAVEVTVRAGDEAASIDVRHRSDIGRAVSGTITSDVAPQFGGAQVTLLSTATKEPIAQGYAVGSNGFALFGIADGDYEIYARQLGESEEAASLPRHITVAGADVTGVELKLLKLGSLSGRVVIERPTANNASNSAAQSSANSASNKGSNGTLNPTAKCESQNRVEEILIRAHADWRNPRSLNSLLAGDQSKLTAPNQKGEFTISALEADGYHLAADLPGEAWYLRAITQPSATNAARSRIDAARNAIALKTGERLTGVEVIVTEGAVSLAGRVMPAKEGGSLPQLLRVHLIPAEPSAADDVLRYRETAADTKGVFEFKHLAPGKYFLLARPASQNEANGATLRPAAYDPTQRTQLRREAEAAKNEIKLEPCSRVKDYVLRY